MVYRSPKATVGSVVYNPLAGKNIIVLTKRNIEPFKGYWCLPGGHIEIFENVTDAIIREVKEETNLDFKPDFLTISEEIFKNIDIHHIAVFFYGPGYGEISKDDTEVTEIKWINIEEALKLNLAFNHNEVLLYYKSFIKN